MESPTVPTRGSALKPTRPPETVKACYFMMCGKERRGPLTPRQMVDLGLTGAHAVWREGLARWTRAADVPELAKLATKLPPPASMLPAVADQPAAPAKPSRAAVYASSAMQLTGHVLGSFGKLDLRREVWPLDGSAAKTMAVDPTFWWVTLLAALPLLFSTLNDPDQTLTAFSLFFAGVWALIFCYVVKGEQVGWGWRLGCFLFTGVLGISGLLLLYQILPAWYVALTASPTVSVQLIGYVTQVGLLEETTKAVPVAVLLLAMRRRLNHADIVLLGLFSGLGFAAFENLSYFRSQLATTVNGAVETVNAVQANTVTGDAALGQLVHGAFNTMLLPLVRSLASPFSHAAWCGIVAHFMGLASRSDAKGRRVALIACGLGIAAVLHGMYDGLFAVQPVLPAAVAVLSFMLLRMYLAGSEAAALPSADPVITPMTTSGVEVAHG